MNCAKTETIKKEACNIICIDKKNIAHLAVSNIDISNTWAAKK